MSLNNFIVTVKESIKNKRKSPKLILFTRFVYNILVVLKKFNFIDDFIIKHFFVKRGTKLVLVKGLLITFKFYKGVNIIKDISTVKKNNNFFYKKKNDKVYSTNNKKFFITTNSGIFVEDELSLLKKGGKFLFSINL